MRTVTYTCDFCEAALDSDVGYRHGKVTVQWITYRHDDGSERKRQVMHLCSPCFEEFFRWAKEQKERKETKA